MKTSTAYDLILYILIVTIIVVAIFAMVVMIGILNGSANLDNLWKIFK